METTLNYAQLEPKDSSVDIWSAAVDTVGPNKEGYDRKPLYAPVRSEVQLPGAANTTAGHSTRRRASRPDRGSPFQLGTMEWRDPQ